MASSPATPPSTTVGRMPQVVRISSRMRRFVALSSTTSTGIPSRSSIWRGGAWTGGAAGTAKGMVKWNWLPWPGWLSTHIRPPMRPTS